MKSTKNDTVREKEKVIDTLAKNYLYLPEPLKSLFLNGKKNSSTNFIFQTFSKGFPSIVKPHIDNEYVVDYGELEQFITKCKTIYYNSLKKENPVTDVALSDLEAELEKAKNETGEHPSIKILYDFVFNKTSLTSAEINEFKSHLERCSKCSGDVALYKFIYGL